MDDGRGEEWADYDNDTTIPREHEMDFKFSKSNCFLDDLSCFTATAQEQYRDAAMQGRSPRLAARYPVRIQKRTNVQSAAAVIARNSHT